MLMFLKAKDNRTTNLGAKYQKNIIYEYVLTDCFVKSYQKKNNSTKVINRT